jgi:hypothetical protein
MMTSSVLTFFEDCRERAAKLSTAGSSPEAETDDIYHDCCQYRDGEVRKKEKHTTSLMITLPLRKRTSIVL